MEFPQIATGSIVRLTVPGNRSSDDEPRQIPAIVLGQFPEDGTLQLFCFHFEGQFLQNAPAASVEVVFSASQRATDLTDICNLVESRAYELEQKFAEFQEQVLGMIIDRPEPALPTLIGTVGPARYIKDTADLLKIIAESPVVAPELVESDPSYPGVASTSSRRQRR